MQEVCLCFGEYKDQRTPAMEKLWQAGKRFDPDIEGEKFWHWASGREWSDGRKKMRQWRRRVPGWVLRTMQESRTQQGHRTRAEIIQMLNAETE